MNLKNNAHGFSLLEVLLALGIFATFITAFFVGQGGNLNDSLQLKREAIMQRLCAMVVNELVVAPPRFDPSLTLSPEEKRFPAPYDDYEYTIVYRRFQLPDLNVLSQGEEGQSSASMSRDQVSIMKKLQANIEEMIWQVEVTVTQRDSGAQYDLSTWLFNEKAQVRVGL